MWWVAAALAVECVSPTAPAQVDAGLVRAEDALRNLDSEGFEQEVVTLSAELLPCLERAVPTTTAARFHRAMAIHLFALGQVEGAHEAALASKRLAPDHVWDDAILPPDHPIREQWVEAELPKVRKVPEPREGFLGFDGQDSRRRPRGVPTISQRFDASGRATWTTYLGPRAPLPTYQAVPRKRNLLIGCSVAAGALGVGSWGAAVWSRSNLAKRAQDPTATAKSLDGLRTRSNALQVASWVGLGVGIGCGAGALVEAL